jgi:hypothetical protein
MVSLAQIMIRLKNEAFRPYYSIRTAYPVWHGLLNHDSVVRFAVHPPTLSHVQQRISSDLRACGIACTTLQELIPEKPDLLSDLQERVHALRAQAVQNRKKPYLLNLFETIPVLDVEDPFFRFMLSSHVVDAVNAYLGMWSKFYSTVLNVTLPIPPGEEASQSQRWHRDPEDRQMCKVFLYLSDVDETSGPFTYVQGSQDGGPHRHLFPQRPPHGYYPPDGAVEARIPREDIRVCTGLAGSVIFADTSGLHKGGYATAKERIMLTSGFLTSASPRGVFFKHPSDSQALSTLSPQIAYAVTGKRYGEGLGY